MSRSSRRTNTLGWFPARTDVLLAVVVLPLGRFARRCDRLGGGSLCWVSVSSMLLVAVIALPPVQADGDRVRAKPGLTVIGEVFDERGKPIVGAVVQMKGWNIHRKVVTSTGGIYQFDGCEPGNAVFMVMAKGRTPQIRRVQIEGGMKPVDLSLKPGQSVRVRVLDERGNPLPNARVVVRGWSSEFGRFDFGDLPQAVDSQGVWEWKEAPLEGVSAQISRPDGMMLPRLLTARKEEYVFRVPPALVISGKVIDAETKRPIDQFRVVPRSRYRKEVETQGLGSPATARNGHYQIRRAYEQFAHIVRIEADGYLPVESRDIKSDEGNVSIDFALKKSVDLVATVFTADGAPAANAKVALGLAGDTILVIDGEIKIIDDNKPRKCWTTDQAGQFHWPPLIDKYWLVVTHPGGFARRKCDPKSNPSNIRLTGWARVEGSLKVGGKLEPKALISIQHSTANAWRSEEGPEVEVVYGEKTDDRGRFRFDRVIPGEGRVGRVLQMSWNEESKVGTSASLVRANFISGETNHIDLGASGRPIIGQLRRSPDSTLETPWSFAVVRVDPTNPKDPASRISFSATVDRDGNFSIDDVPTGKYVLNAAFLKPPRDRLANHPFEVPAIEEKLSQRPVDLGVLTMDSGR
jgi:hypothetical protein